MESFLKSTKGYINSFRSTDDSKRKSSKQTLSTFSPTFVGDVYENSVEVHAEENYSNTTDNIYLSPECKVNPENAEDEHDTSEALEDTALAEYVQALNAVTTSDSKTLTEKPSEETETTSSLNSASSSVASPSHEDLNEADQQDCNSLSKTERDNDRSSSPTEEAASSKDLERNVKREDKNQSERVEGIDNCRENEDRLIPYVENAERSKEDVDAHLQLTDDSRSLSESASFQGEVIQHASAEILAALSFLQPTEEKDPSEQPSQVEASDSTEIVGNLFQTSEAELLGPSDEVEENNIPDDEVSFPDLVALISEIETSFDEVENQEVDCISQDEESYNTALNLPQSDTDSLREGADPEAESDEQRTGLSFVSPLAQAKSRSEDIPDLELIAEEQQENLLSFEDQPTLCSSNVPSAHLRELGSLARKLLKGNHESDSDLCVENSFEASQELPTELVELEIEASESEQSTEILTEEGSIDSLSDTKEETKSISEQSESREPIVVEEATCESRFEESASANDEKVITVAGTDLNEQTLFEELSSEKLAAATTDIDTNEEDKSGELAFTEPNERTQPEEPVSLEDTAPATERQTHCQSEEPVVSEQQAEEVEPAVAEEQAEEVAAFTDFNTNEQAQSEEPVGSEQRAKEFAAATVTDSIEQVKSDVPVVGEEQTEVAAVTVTESVEPRDEEVVSGEQVEEVAAVAVTDSIEQVEPEERVIVEEQAEEVAAVTVIDSIESTDKQVKPKDPIVAEEQVEEVAVHTAVITTDFIEPTDEQLASNPIEHVESEVPVGAAEEVVSVTIADSIEPVEEQVEVAAVTTTDSIEQVEPEEQVAAKEQEEVAAVTVTDSIQPTDEQVEPKDPVVAEEVSAVTLSDSIEQIKAEESIVAKEQEEVASVTVTDSIEPTPTEEPSIVLEEDSREIQAPVPVQAEKEVAAATQSANDQAQSEEEVAAETQPEEQGLVQNEEVAAAAEPVSNEQRQPEEKVDTKTLKEENMQVRDAGFSEEKKDEDDVGQVSMEPMETNLAEVGKNSLQMSTPETGSISPPKAEGRDDDRSETSDVVGLSPEISGSSVSKANSASLDDAIDMRRAKSDEKHLSPQRDKSLLHGSFQDQGVANQTSPRTPLRTKSPPKERSKTPTKGRSELEKQEIIPKKKLTEYIRKDLWNRKKPDVVLEAIKAVAEAAIQTESRSAIARAGGLLALIRAMEDHVDDVAIQIASCSALERLALDPENEIAIAEIGGVDAVLGAMMCHFKNAELHEAAWSTLWNLTCVNSAEEMTIDTAGGMQAIVSCMKQHINNPMVQKNACGALTNLCLHSEARLQALSDAGGFVAISSALQKHFKNMEVRKQASFALTSLLESHAGQYEADHGM